MALSSNPAPPGVRGPSDRPSHSPFNPDLHGGRQSGPGLGPAALVLGLAVLIVVSGAVASLVFTGGTSKPSVDAVAAPGGPDIAVETGATAFRSAEIAGQPPQDILDNLGVPAGSVSHFTVNAGKGSSHYDQTVTFTVQLQSSRVVTFFRTFLRRQHWRIIYSGQGTDEGISGQEVLAEQASNDGYYWELGVISSPSTPTGTTPFSMVLYEVPDND